MPYRPVGKHSQALQYFGAHVVLGLIIEYAESSYFQAFP